jgi:hypothetical protein
MDHAKEAEVLLNFADVEAQIDKAAHEFQSAVTSVRQSSDDSLGRVSATINEMTSNLADVADNNKVIDELVDMQRTAGSRLRARLGWALQELDDVASATANAEDAHEPLLDVARRWKLSPATDHLEEIKRRGVLRVGVEPGFVGLSFRRRPREPLMGLDVDYARAYAQSIGVTCEFVEYPWDALTGLLHVGIKQGEPPVDVIWSALPPNAAYRQVAYSETYTYLPFVLARRVGDMRIRKLDDLDGKVLGIINDPGAFEVLDTYGVRQQGQARAKNFARQSRRLFRPGPHPRLPCRRKGRRLLRGFADLPLGLLQSGEPMVRKNRNLAGQSRQQALLLYRRSRGEPGERVASQKRQRLHQKLPRQYTL